MITPASARAPVTKVIAKRMAEGRILGVILCRGSGVEVMRGYPIEALRPVAAERLRRLASFYTQKWLAIGQRYRRKIVSDEVV